MRSYLILFIVTFVALFVYSWFFVEIPIKDSVIAILLLTAMATFIKYGFDRIFNFLKFFKKKSS
jgi:hypothetical protein